MWYFILLFQLIVGVFILLFTHYITIYLTSMVVLFHKWFYMQYIRAGMIILKIMIKCFKLTNKRLEAQMYTTLNYSTSILHSHVCISDSDMIYMYNVTLKGSIMHKDYF